MHDGEGKRSESRNAHAFRYIRQPDSFFSITGVAFGKKGVHLNTNMSEPLTDRQQQVLDFIHGHHRQHGVAPSIRELALALELPPDRVASTVDAFNAAVRDAPFDFETLDGCRTEGLTPPKSHWARRLDTRPFWGYPLRPGITFTYLGVTVDDTSRVVMNGVPSRNLFAAGEVMAGNVLRRGYLAGIGMTIGTVFGRLAGAEAANAAR
jgi:succinate dehydrogenase/fumarate reductase flavoprotein subunit